MKVCCDFVATPLLSFITLRFVLVYSFPRVPVFVHSFILLAVRSSQLGYTKKDSRFKRR